VIDAKTLQTFLKTEGFYSGTIDGIFGSMSVAAGRADIKAHSVNASLWENSRVYVGVEQLFLNKVMNAGLLVDGLAGTKTNDAIYAYNVSILVPVSNTWPRQFDVRAGTSMFGRPGTDQVMCELPYLMYGDYERKIKVSAFQCHAKVEVSLKRIFQRTLDHYGSSIRSLNLDIFSGCYNYRSVVGGSGSLSLHAWGVALDVDAAHNQLNESSSEAAFSKPEYAPFLNFFEAEGWISLGRARNYDWMHFQAARL
jgi:hypothetical protein